jgi:hypothetical protein
MTTNRCEKVAQEKCVILIDKDSNTSYVSLLKYIFNVKDENVCSI